MIRSDFDTQFLDQHCSKCLSDATFEFINTSIRWNYAFQYQWRKQQLLAVAAVAAADAASLTMVNALNHVNWSNKLLRKNIDKLKRQMCLNVRLKQIKWKIKMDKRMNVLFSPNTVEKAWNQIRM